MCHSPRVMRCSRHLISFHLSDALSQSQVHDDQHHGVSMQVCQEQYDAGGVFRTFSAKNVNDDISCDDCNMSI